MKVHQVAEGVISDTNFISDYDLDVAKRRVYNILKTTSENNELVACLPLVVRRNGRVLRVVSLEKKEHVDFIKDACLKYYEDKGVKPSGKKGERKKGSHKTKRDIKENKVNGKDAASAVVSQHHNKKHQPYTKVNPVFAEAISLFLKFKCVNLKKRDIIEKFGLLNNVIKFISCIEILADIAAESLFQSDKEIQDKTEELSKAARNSKKLDVIIDELLVKVENLKRESSKQLAEKEVALEQLQDKKNSIVLEFRNQLNDAWISSAFDMADANADSEERSDELKSKVKALTETYATLCNHNLSTEKKLKNKCNKVESQLASWLVKYDSDVGDKRMEYEKLQEELDEVESAIEDVENMLADLDPQYLKFKEEEDEEIQEKFNEMAYKFLLNRSAMTIQRYWRAYRLEKKSKKKGKGGKKGKGKK